MKKFIYFIITTLIIGFIPLPILAQGSFDPASLSDLKLPQPEAEVIANMQPPLTVTYEPPPTISRTSIFGRILLKTSVSQPEVLGVKDEALKSVSTTRRSQITIAVIGDSMVDTMGTYLPYLSSALKSIYPNTDFFLFNYGIGSTNINSGLERLTASLEYQDRSYPAPISLNPDLVIIESFAYNPLPLSESNLVNHTQGLTNMVNLLRSRGIANIMLLTTIAPDHQQFGAGPNGVNWSIEAITEHTRAIHAYLENTVNVANSLSVPLIDAFHPSQDGNGNGQSSLINQSDHIHPSVAGHQFIARHIADKIASTHILE